jgi:hypothetical protein
VLDENGGLVDVFPTERPPGPSDPFATLQAQVQEQQQIIDAILGVNR